MAVVDTSTSQRALTQRRMLEIYCTLLPAQAAEAMELIHEGVSLATIASLYPFDIDHLLANLQLPAGKSGSDLVANMVGLWYGTEDELYEVEGGRYGAAGTVLNVYCTGEAYRATMRYIREQARSTDVIRHASAKSVIESLFWYTWCFQRWDLLAEGPRTALFYALEGLRTHLRDCYAEAFCDLEWTA